MSFVSDPSPLSLPIASAPAEAPSVGFEGNGVNKELSASLRADFEALENDLEQANAMTLDLQCQLAGKSNEFALLKHVFEKTSKNLAHLQADITSLREERHRLANEAMEATALQFTLDHTIKQRDQLQEELESQKRNFEKKIADLEADLRKPTKEEPSVPPNRSTTRLSHPKASALLAEISQSLTELREIIDLPQPRSEPASSHTDRNSKPDFINISFTG